MSDPVDLDALAARVGRVLDLGPDDATEAVVTLAEHRDRRVIAPLLDLIASRRVNELMVRGAGWLADPALHPALVDLAATRLGDLGDDGYWHQVDRAIARCRPDAAEEAEEIEVKILTAAQGSMLELGAEEIEIGLDGEYPGTAVVLRVGERERRVPIWDFDELSPDDPTSLDVPFALYRVTNLASWG